MLSTGYRRSALSAAAVKRLVIASLSSAATGNKPPGGSTKGTALRESIKDGMGQNGQDGGDRKRPKTQWMLTTRSASLNRGKITEMIARVTGRSATHMPIASPLQTLGDQGPPFQPLSLSDLMECDLYYQLIKEHKVKIPDLDSKEVSYHVFPHTGPGMHVMYRSTVMYTMPPYERLVIQ